MGVPETPILAIAWTGLFRPTCCFSPRHKVLSGREAGHIRVWSKSIRRDEQAHRHPAFRIHAPTATACLGCAWK